MLIRYYLLLLGFFVGCNSHAICNFERHLCKWSHLYNCHFALETEKSLLGEKGYLYLSKNICRRAGIEIPVYKYMHRFQLHYFINGTGHGKLAVYAAYTFSSRTLLWSCKLNQGLRWNKADIFVYDDSWIDSISSIDIEAIVSGDMTIAIGNISPAYSGNPLRECPKPPKPMTRKPTTIKRTHKSQTTRTTTILSKTSSIRNVSAKAETYHTDRVSYKAPNTYSSEAITIQSSMTTLRASDQTEQRVSAKTHHQKVTKIIDVTTNPEGQQESTYVEGVNTLPTTDVTNEADLGSFEKLESSKSKHRNLIIGSSVFAVILALVFSGFALLCYTRRIKLWNVKRANREVSGFSNPVYR